MVRLFLLDVIPSLIFVALITATWVYDRSNFLPAGLIYGLLYLVYSKLNRIEFALSEDMREALLLKTDNRLVYGMGKLLLAGGVASGLYFNEKNGWVDVHSALARAGVFLDASPVAQKPGAVDPSPAMPRPEKAEPQNALSAGEMPAEQAQQDLAGPTARRAEEPPPSTDRAPTSHSLDAGRGDDTEPLRTAPVQADRAEAPVPGRDSPKKPPKEDDPAPVKPPVAQPGGAPPLSDFKIEED